MPIGMLFFLPVTEILIDTGISTDRTYPHTHLASLVWGGSGFLLQEQLDSWNLNLVFKGTWPVFISQLRLPLQLVALFSSSH